MEWSFGEEWNPNVPCHGKCDIIKNPICSKVVTAKQKSKYTNPLPTVNNGVFISLENFRVGCKTTNNHPIMQQAMGVVIS